jgi:hypothetical protein
VELAVSSSQMGPFPGSLTRKTDPPAIRSRVVGAQEQASLNGSSPESSKLTTPAGAAFATKILRLSRVAAMATGWDMPSAGPPILVIRASPFGSRTSTTSPVEASAIATSSLRNKNVRLGDAEAA